MGTRRDAISPQNKGGLGIANLRLAVPRMLLDRIKNADKSNHPLIMAWLGTSECGKLKSDLLLLLTEKFKDQSYVLDSVKNYREYWAERVLSTADGKGFRSFETNPVGNRWISGHSKVLSKGMFVRAVQLRFNALPCGANAARHLRRTGCEFITDSHGLPSRDSFPAPCRYKCNANETIAHITQCCFYTRTCLTQERHDRLVTDIARHLVERGYRVVTEKTFRTSDGNRRPDIVAAISERVFILDVTCPFETQSHLNAEAVNKRNYYSSQSMKDAVKEYFELSANCSIEAYGLVFGARGGLAPMTYDILRSLGVAVAKIQLWTELTIFRTLLVYDHFMKGHNWHRTAGRPIFKP